MQRKWLFVATLATIFCVASVSAIVLDDVNDVSGDEAIGATGDDKITYHVKLNKNEERTLSIITNEIYYQQMDKNHITQWYYFNGTNYVLLDLSRETSVSTDFCTFRMYQEEDCKVGEYKLFMKGNDSITSGLYDIKLQCTITIHIQESIDSFRSYTTDPLYIDINVSGEGGSILPIGAVYKVTQESTQDVDSTSGIIQIKEGIPVSIVPESLVGASAYPASKYNWYAYNLPKGLAMTKEGTISGVPVTTSTEYDPSIIYVEDGYGNGGTFKIWIAVNINESSMELTFYLYNGDFTASSSFIDAKYEPNQFMSQRDKIVSLITDKDVDVLVVSVSSEEGTTTIERETINGSTLTIEGKMYYKYSLPTEGTGMYRVMMNDKVSDKLLDVFDFYVMSKVLAVQSEIIVGSDGSS